MLINVTSFGVQLDRRAMECVSGGAGKGAKDRWKEIWQNLETVRGRQRRQCLGGDEVIWRVASDSGPITHTTCRR